MTLESYHITTGMTITLSNLIPGSNLTARIIPIDTGGREGPSATIQYIWNGMNNTLYILIVFLIVPVQVTNVSWVQRSCDSVMIWWNNTEVSYLILLIFILYYLRTYVLLQSTTGLV